MTIALLFIGFLAVADDLPSMNEIQLRQFGDFTKDWKLVTVRYRTDSEEMRFTYANRAAYDVLVSGGKNYPDGAVFAKVGIKTVADPAFTSSVVPGESRRFQFMVRNKKKYGNADGWGYALFDSNGALFPEDPGVQTMACHACHKLVADRGFVFSQHVELSPFKKFAVHAAKPGERSRVAFERTLKAKIPEIIQQFVPRDAKAVDLIKGEITKNFFQGTLDEIRPTLIRRVKESGVPACFISADTKQYVIAIPSKDPTVCQGDGRKGVQPITVITKTLKRYCD
jgi:hypothetical protein